MAVNWKKLEHNGGAAVDVPKWVEHLVAGGEPHKYWSELDEAFDASGNWFSASAAALALLLTQAPKAKKPEWVLRAAADILGADQSRAWLYPAVNVPEEVAAVLAEHLGGITKALTRKDAFIRSAAGFVLGAVPQPQLELATEALLAGLASESEPAVLASMLLALARSSTTDVQRVLEKHTKHDVALVRGAAALGLIKAFPAVAITDVAQPLSDWLKYELTPVSGERAELLWFSRYQPPGGTFQCPIWRSGAALGMVLEARGAVDKRTGDLIGLAGANSDGLVRRGVSDALLVAYGFHEYRPEWALPAEDLSEVQRGLAKALVETNILPAAGYGLSAMGVVRERWLGLSSPAGLEAPGKAANSKKTQPLYVAWRQWLESEDAWKNEIPPQLAGLEGVERWQAAVEYAVGAYLAGGKSYQQELVEREIASACADPKLKAAAPAVLEECARVLREIRLQRRPAKVSGSTSALMLVPALRAGLPWQSSWGELVGVSNDCVALVREVLDVLPTDWLEEWFWSNEHNLLVESNYADLFTSERLARRILEKVSEKKRGAKKTPEVCTKVELMLEGVAKTRPPVAKALNEYQANAEKPKKKK